MELSLENCEVIRFNAGYVRFVYLGEVTETITVTSNVVSKYKKCEYAEIFIHKESNTVDSNVTHWSEELPFDRITKFSDIVSVDLIYDDGSEDSIYVKWMDGDDFVNHYQHNEIIQGDLKIIIGSTKR